MERGRKDEARASLLHLRRGKANYDPAGDLFLLEEAVAHQAVLAAGSSWRQCFCGSNGFRCVMSPTHQNEGVLTRKTDLRRTFIVAGTQCLQQGPSSHLRSASRKLTVPWIRLHQVRGASFQIKNRPVASSPSHSLACTRVSFVSNYLVVRSSD